VILDVHGRLLFGNSLPCRAARQFKLTIKLDTRRGG
jgi:hypothetical protein